MPAPGALLKLSDNPVNRSSNYWFALLSQNQTVTLARVGPDGLWDVVFVGVDGTPHVVEGVQPERFTVVPERRRRWWQFWRRA